MKKGLVDFVIVGADRIASNGDTANKIGTYSLAVNANYNSIPFYVAAPSTSIDYFIFSGDEIIIEERSPEELYSLVVKELFQKQLVQLITHLILHQTI